MAARSQLSCGQAKRLWDHILVASRKVAGEKIMRRAFGLLLALTGLLLILASAAADDYPSRPVTLIAPWPPAGAIDTLCRELAPGVGDLLGQPVVVEDRPGAGSTIGTADGARAKPDGYTLVMAGTGSLAISPTLYRELPYDPRKDFAPIALVARVPFILVVNPSLPIQSVQDLIAYAKAHPGSLTYGSGGAGSPHQLFAEMFKSVTGVDLTHVPYKGSAPALSDVIGGHIALMFADPAPTLPMVKAGKVRALGVTSAARLPSAPDIPPLAEVGVPGFDAAGWGMVVAPAHTPAAIVTKLYDAFRAAGAQRQLRDRLILMGMTPQEGPAPSALQDFIDDEMRRWGKAVEAAGLAGTE
jgi:tripartite-type tricarboxylate transporter receptor subunit TctC